MPSSVVHASGRERDSQWSERAGLTIALLSVFVAGYFGLAAWGEGRATVALGLPIDDRVPLVVGSVWVYSTVYTAWSVPLFLVQSRQLFRRVAMAFGIVLAVSFVGFVLVPASTEGLRPLAADIVGEGFAAWGLRLLYQLDPPTNCFPSLHVGLFTVSAVLIARTQRSAVVWAVLWWAAVCLSTLTTRQHYVVDVVGGAMVGGAAAAFAFRGQERELGPGLARGLTHYALFHAGCIAMLFAGFSFGL